MLLKKNDIIYFFGISIIYISFLIDPQIPLNFKINVVTLTSMTCMSLYCLNILLNVINENEIHKVLVPTTPLVVDDEINNE